MMDSAKRFFESVGGYESAVSTYSRSRRHKLDPRLTMLTSDVMGRQEKVHEDEPTF